MMWSVHGAEHAGGAAKSRRERRFRQFLRHEHLTVSVLLAEMDHHAVPRGQTQARSGEDECETHPTATIWKTPPPQQVSFELIDSEDIGGLRQACLAEPSGPAHKTGWGVQPSSFSTWISSLPCCRWLTTFSVPAPTTFSSLWLQQCTDDDIDDDAMQMTVEEHSVEHGVDFLRERLCR